MKIWDSVYVFNFSLKRDGAQRIRLSHKKRTQKDLNLLFILRLNQSLEFGDCESDKRFAWGVFWGVGVFQWPMAQIF